jgi:hypothetical protein
MSATASRRSPWQNPRRRRQAATGVGLLLLGYVLLVLIALLGGPRIGAPFLPLPGGPPEPASPIAGLQPGQPTENVAIPHQTTSTPAATPDATPSAGITSPLPTATTPGEPQLPTGSTTTPYPPRPEGTPTPETAETTAPPLPPATRRPPIPPPTPSTRPTVDPTAPPTTTPTTSPSPTASPTTPDNPGGGGGLGGTLSRLLHKLGL